MCPRDRIRCDLSFDPPTPGLGRGARREVGLAFALPGPADGPEHRLHEVTILDTFIPGSLEARVPCYPGAAMDSTPFLLFVSLLLVGANGFFVAAEFALVKVRTTRLDQLIVQGRRGARLTRQMVGHIDQYLSACQLGITLASLGLGWVGEPAFARLVEIPLEFLGVGHPILVHSVAVVFAFTLITCLHVVLGELAPKSLAIQYTESVALSVAWPMNVFFRLTSPFIRFLTWAGNRVLLAAGLPPPDEGAHVHSTAELRMILQECRRSGELSEDDFSLVDRALDFSATSVAQVMRPRGDIDYASLADPIEETARKLQETNHTRIPLCRHNLDDIIGVLNVRDLVRLGALPSSPDQLLQLRREPFFVPETARVVNLVKQMKKSQALMAIVVDEYGVVSGIVTMEDALEELVGEIQDEYDHDDPAIRPAKGGGFLVEGTVTLRTVNRRFLLDIQCEGAETVSGYLLSRLGRLANVGDTVTVANYLVRVVEMKEFRVATVLFVPQHDSQTAE